MTGTGRKVLRCCQCRLQLVQLRSTLLLNPVFQLPLLKLRLEQRLQDKHLLRRTNRVQLCRSIFLPGEERHLGFQGGCHCHWHLCNCKHHRQGSSQIRGRSLHLENELLRTHGCRNRRCYGRALLSASHQRTHTIIKGGESRMQYSIPRQWMTRRRRSDCLSIYNLQACLQAQFGKLPMITSRWILYAREVKLGPKLSLLIIYHHFILSIFEPYACGCQRGVGYDLYEPFMSIFIFMFFCFLF